MELSTGKAFNAFPPGWQRAFDSLRDLHNIRNGWTRPDDPERTRFCAPSHADIMEARLLRWGKNPTRSEKEEARDYINAYLKAKMETGTVRDRADVVTALREAGLDINREGKDYITVKDPDSGEKIRLKGGIYGADWQLEKLGRAHEGKSRTGTDRDGEGFHRTVADLEQQLAGIIAKRAAYNVGRYGAGDYERGGDVEPALQAFERGFRQKMDRFDSAGDMPLHRDDSGRVVSGADIGNESERATHGIGTAGERPGDTPRGGEGVGNDVQFTVGSNIGDRGNGEGRQPLRDGTEGERERTHYQRATGTQVEGIANHEQERTGNDCAALSRTNRDRSENGTGEPRHQNSENREAGGRLREAIDAAVRIVSQFKTAYRRLEQYLIERRQTVEREAERKSRGMSR